VENLQRLFDAQRAAFNGRAPDYDRRMEALAALRDMLMAHRVALADAVSADFGGRPREETFLLELVPLLDEIRYARKHLAKWMKPRRAGSTWFLMPSRAYTIHQPLGVVGVIGAWNYPLLLTLSPVIDAIAAGNHVMLKPSELSAQMGARLAEAIAERFPAEYITVVRGERDVAEAFSRLPFDHLLFTGSATVGSKVMAAASQHLTPVTLELGGKSPAIIHPEYPLERALRRILVGKLYNAGQTCVAPDYLLAPQAAEPSIADLATKIVSDMYPRLVESSSYTRIVSRAQYERLSAAVEEARSLGARVVTINPANEDCSADNKVFPPTLVFGAPRDSLLLRNEIFGPVLPVVEFRLIDEALEYVRSQPRPLALYYFDDDSRRADALVHATVSGGVLINDVMYHLGQHSLPFGGVGPSGMGRYHGQAGFETFSNRRGVMVQSRWPPTRFFAPPFTERTKKLIGRLLRLSAR
jgi:coniferyl-aldehyde dehydrogenase